MHGRLRSWLGLTWWLIFPAFLAVVTAFTWDRMCFDRFTLLPSVATRPALAWLTALMYLAAHLWVIAAYVFTATRTRDIIPHPRAARDAWGRGWPQVLAMVLLMGIEYAPAGIWVGLGGIVCD